MKNDDLWNGIQPSPSETSLVGHLVVDCRPYEIFRARDSFGRRVLFFVHDPENTPATKLPQMAGLAIEVFTKDNDEMAVLVVRLENDEDADVFTRFCDDLIATVASSKSEATAVQSFVGRMWKWHALLKGARKKTLSREAQIGLIGELHTLQDIISPVKGLGVALDAWRGSEGAPKDFELSLLCIECKARGASSREKIRITSEHQLADVPGHKVLLLIHTFAAGAETEMGSKNLHQAVASLRSNVSSERPDLASMLETKLEEAGYDDEHEYDVVVVHRSTQAFQVEGDFPRIIPSAYPDGPLEISYDLPLAKLVSFEISQTDLSELLENSELTDV